MEMGKYCGMKIIVPPLVKQETKRTWKERLFTLPWQPFVTHNIRYIETIKDGEVLKTADSYFMNQATYEDFKRKISS